METKYFPQANTVAKGNKEVKDLNIHYDKEHGISTSRWVLTPTEKMHCLFFNEIWLSIWNSDDNLQPCLIQTENPFIKLEEDTTTIIKRLLERKVQIFANSIDRPLPPEIEKEFKLLLLNFGIFLFAGALELEIQAPKQRHPCPIDCPECVNKECEECSKCQG